MATDPKKLQEAQKILEKINAIYRELGKTEINLVDKKVEELPGLLNKAKGELSDMEGSATNLYEQLRGVTLEIGGQQTTIAKARKGFRDITKAADELLKDEQEINKLNLKQLGNLKSRAELAKADIVAGANELKTRSKGYALIQKELDAMAKVNATAEELNVYRQELIQNSTKLSDEEKAILLTQEDQNGVLDEIIQKAQDRLALEQKIENQASAYSKTAEFITSLPGLKAFAGPFEKAAEAVKKVSREAKGAASGLQMASAAAGEIGKSMLVKGVALGGVFTFLKKAVFSVNAKQVEISKNLGLGEERAKKVYKQFKAISQASGDTLMLTKNLINANMQLGNTFGTMAGFSAEQLKTQVDLTKKIGLQEVSASKLQSLAMASNISSSDALQSINEQNAALKLKTGITLSSKDILEEVANTEGELASNYKNNPSLIAKAVTQVRKLGLSLSQAAKVSDNLLDFESSLAAEMEAEVMLGKDLNLNKARALALDGDAAGATAEVMKQVKALGGLSQMDVLTKRALAKAAGLTVDELANQEVKEKNLAKLGAQERKRLKEQVAELRAKGKVEEANRLMSVAGNAQELEAAQKRLSFEDRINAAKDFAIEKLSEMLTANGGIEAIVERVVGFFEALPNHLGLIRNILTAMIGLMVTFKVASIAAGIAQAAIAAGATMTASAVSLGIAIPAIIAGAAVAYGAYKMMSMDAPKPANDVAIPAGYGNNMITGPKGSIALNNKDSIIAGTNLFGGKGDNGASEKLMNKIDRLIAVVEQGGHVYLDGSKVGSAMALSAKLSN